MKTKNSLYLVLTIIFVILSVIGGYFLYQVVNQRQNSPLTTNSETTPIPTNIPTITLTPIATTSPIASSSVKSKLTPTPTPTKKIASPTATIKPTSTLKPTATPKNSEPVESTPTLTSYESTEDGFSIDYLSSRKVYPDSESSGRRYTFYLASGNFAVHVGLDDQWAWTTSDRNFSGDFLVAGQNTYRYDISTQTIIDLQYNDKNYTIQCVHNGKESLKTECEEFISSFQFI